MNAARLRPRIESVGCVARFLRFAFIATISFRLASMSYADTSVVIGQTLSTQPLRTDWNDYVGFRFTTGSVPLTVSQLGRWVVSGNSHTHTVEIVEAATNTVICSASVATTGTPGQFAYGSVSGGAHTLLANHVYYLLSLESNGGGADSWYQADTSLTTTPDITINNEEYKLSGNYYSSNDFGTGGHSYGPVSFMYSLAPASTTVIASTEAITGAALGSLRTDGTYDVGFRFSTGNNNLNVTQLGRWALGNGNSHLVEIVDANNTTAPLVSAYVSTSTSPTSQFAYSNCTATTLLANHSYYLLCHETGSDPWYQDNTALIHTSDITITNPAYHDTIYHDLAENGSTNRAFGPASFRYDSQTIVTGVSPGSDGLRNDWPNYVGFKFTTGTVPLLVSYLGRWLPAGQTSSHTHAMKIVDDSNGDVICTGTVDASAVTAGQFAYAPLASTAILQANHTYYVLSDENDTSDYWYAGHCAIVPTSDITVIAPEYQDGSSYYTDGSPGDLGNYSYGPVTFLYSQFRPSWTFQTSDTILTLNVFGAPFVTQLANANTKGWDWGATSSVVPLPRYVYTGLGTSGAQYIPNWVFTSSSVDLSNGQKVTLTYKSIIGTGTTQNLTLCQTWWAYPGVGPVQQTTNVTNATGDYLTYSDADIIPADFTANSDADATLWTFKRGTNLNDANFFQSVTTTTLNSTAGAVTSTVSNIAANGEFQLPFAMLDVSGSNHGIYFGYDKPFGIFKMDNTVWSSQPDKIRCTFSLWDSSNGQYFAQPDGTTSELPGIFFGAYVGDTDDGSNLMKQWFWNNKITPTIKTTSNEPLVVVAAAIDTDVTGHSGWPDNQASNFFSTDYPSLSSWGVEMVKEDSQWTDDWGVTTTGFRAYGWDWDPAPAQWPSGLFEDPYLAHTHGLKLDLYMANTYKGADLSTTAGQTSEENALTARFDGTATNFEGGFDYWRTDQYYEPDITGSTGTDGPSATNVYGHHLGFLTVMDYMITNRGGSGFRWENTSTASKKSFDFLQRQSFGIACDESISDATTVDDYRVIYYSNSYMMNPVQIDDQNQYVNSSNTSAEATYEGRTGYLGAWMHFLDAGFTQHDDVYHNLIGPYQSYQRPILKNANVYHILPAITSSHNAWDGTEFFNTTLNKGSVVLFKQYYASSSPTIWLKGLVATATYTLTYEDRPGLNFSATGSQLMAGGTGIPSISGSSGDFDSEIIWINK